MSTSPSIVPQFQRHFHALEGRRAALVHESWACLLELDLLHEPEAERRLEARGWQRPFWLDHHAEPVCALEREGADGAYGLVDLDSFEPLRDGARFRVPDIGGVYRISVWWSAVFVQNSESVGLWGRRESARVPFLPAVGSPEGAGALAPDPGIAGRVLHTDGTPRAHAIVWVTSARGAPRVGALITDAHGRFATGPVNVREVLFACECPEGSAWARVDGSSAIRVELVLGR
jgi:hypothetical protein